MEEKQWFLYVVDKHEGPFTLKEIEQFIAKGDALPSSFVWREGLADWMMLSELSEFAPGKVGTDSTGKPAFIVPQSQSAAGGQVKVAKSTGTSESAKALGMSGGPSTRRYRWYKSTKFFIFMLLVLGGGVYHALTIGALDSALRPTGLSGKSLGLPTIASLAPNTAALTPLLSPLKKLISEQVEPRLPPALKKYLISVELPAGIPLNQAEILKGIAKEDISKGIKAGLAILPGEEANPAIIVVSNAPDATDFTVNLVGKQGTLLNSFGYQQTQHAKIMGHVGQTARFAMDQSKPLPKGEYAVSVQTGGRQLSGMDVFLGGARDASYEERISEFNQRISERIRQSVTELTQIADTLGSMANESAVTFTKTLKIKAPGIRKKQWEAYRGNYSKISAQINELISKAYSDPLPIGNIPSAYDEAKKVFEITEKLHLTETSVIEGKEEMAAVRPLAAEAMKAIAALKEKVKSVR